MDLTILRELGFTEREVKVYVALLELGQSTAGPIASKAKLAHPKVYDTLERLIEKGLVNYVIVSKTKHFTGVEPKELFDILKDKENRLKEIVKELEEKNKYAKEKQVAIVHEGFNAFKALFNRLVDELHKGDLYYAFAFKEDYRDPSASLFLANFHRKLAEKGVIDKAIVNQAVKSEVVGAFRGNENIQLRFVKRSTPLGVIIAKNRVIQLTWGDLPTAIEIDSSQVHQYYKEFFEDLWKEAKK